MYTPLSQIAPLLGLSYKVAKQRAAVHQLPFPAIQFGSRKAPWMVNTNTFTQYQTNLEIKANREHKRVNT